MTSRTITLLVVFVLTAGGAWWRDFGPEAAPQFDDPTFMVVQGSSKTPHRLHRGDTVKTALAALSNPSTQPASDTLLLIRRGPDGLARELIDTDDGHLVDPKKDQTLRNGDHLVVSSPGNPEGLKRPPGPGIPVSE